MHKKFLILVLSFLSLTSSWGQDTLEKYRKGISFLANYELEKAYESFDAARPANTQYPELSDSEKQILEYRCLRNMGDCSYHAGNMGQSMSDYLRAFDVARLLSDREEYEVLSEMKKVRQTLLDMKEVAHLSDMLDSIADSTDDANVRFLHLERLAEETEKLGDYSQSEKLYLEQLKMIDSINEDNRDPALIRLYQSLRNVYRSMKQYDKALQFNNKAFEFAQDRELSTDFKTGLILFRAILFADAGQRDSALQTLDSLKSRLSESNNELKYHSYASIVYKQLGDNALYAQETKAVLDIMDSAGFKDENYYSYVRSLGKALFLEKEYDKAMPYYKAYGEYCRKQYGERSKTYADALRDMGNLEAFMGNTDKGGALYAQSVDIQKQIISGRLKYVSLQQRESFWNDFAPSLRNMTSFAMKAGKTEDEFTKTCYNALLFSKSLLLESDKTMAEAINQYCSPEEKQTYYDYLAIRQRMDNLAKNSEKDNQQVAELQGKASSLNNKLTSIISRLGYTDFLSKEYNDIKASLNEDEVLFDFADFYSDKKVTQHMAYVIRSNRDCPLLIKYVTTEDVMSLLDGFPIDRIHDARLQERVQEMFWKPLSPYVAGKKTIYYVPSGILHQIALESIPMNDGSLLGEHYNFVRLTSAREIERYKSNMDISDKSNALLYGGLRYSLDDETMQMAAAKYDTPKLFAMRGTLRGDSIFHELPYTLEEVTGTKKILDRQGIHAEVLSGADGTEESFICLDGKAPQILHLSTHGFYYTPEQATEVAYLNGYKDAMALSGLILSGGNAAWLGKELPKNVLGGVLTANTIARLDLKGIDLLFLAACQTGNGKVTPEGIYGLQRAFKKAGVKTIVMSLWDVDDKVAKEFSVRFYEELTKNGWDKRKAFEKAKSRIRKMEDYKEPFYWAGFVMLD